jgi:hypothetical protein
MDVVLDTDGNRSEFVPVDGSTDSVSVSITITIQYYDS